MIVEKVHSITFMDPSVSTGTIFTYGTHIRRGLAQGVNTWDDWHLIPASRPEIVAPEVYTNYVDLPGAHGKLDLSEYLTGGPVFKNRSGSLQFYALREHGFWAERYNQICNFLHGRRLQMVLYDEPEYFYTGRFRVESWQSDGQAQWSTVTINYELDPFKFHLPEPPLDTSKPVGQQDRQGYWDRFLFEDLHKNNYLWKIPLDSTNGLEQTIKVSGYTHGFMMDAFIDEASTFPCKAQILLNGGSSEGGVTFTVWQDSADGHTQKHISSGTALPINRTNNTIVLSRIADSTYTGNPKVNLVCYGGEL